MSNSGPDNLPDNEHPGELLDDLESIKTLLDEEDDVPLLQDVESPGVPIDEATPGVQPRAGTQEQARRLLGEAWQDSVQQMFEDTRNRIQANSGAWLPEQTEELSTALKIRLDETVAQWMAQTLQNNIDGLRRQVVTELTAEIEKHLEHLGEKDT